MYLRTEVSVQQLVQYKYITVHHSTLAKSYYRCRQIIALSREGSMGSIAGKKGIQNGYNQAPKAVLYQLTSSYSYNINTRHVRSYSTLPLLVSRLAHQLVQR